MYYKMYVDSNQLMKEACEDFERRAWNEQLRRFASPVRVST